MPAKNKKQVIIHMTAREKRTAAQNAEVEGVSLSEFIRRSIENRVTNSGGNWPGETKRRGKYDREAAAERRSRESAALCLGVEPAELTRPAAGEAIAIVRRILPDPRISGKSGVVTAELEANAAYLWQSPDGEYFYDVPSRGGCALELLIYDQERGLVMDDSGMIL